MRQSIDLSKGLGEVMAPQTMVTALVATPDGRVWLDPGALHGRSRIEGEHEFVKSREAVGEGQACWVVWVAIELDASNQPVRLKGASVSEMLLNPATHIGYKSVAEGVNCMSEAMRGGVNVGRLPPSLHEPIARQLRAIGDELWARAPEALRAALRA